MSNFSLGESRSDTNAQEDGGVVSEGEEPEYRIYIDSRGSMPVLWMVIGGGNLEEAIRFVARIYPDDTIYIRELTETMVRVIGPQNKKGETMAEKQQGVYAIVVYTLDDGSEERFKFYSEEGLENEIKWANSEHDHPTYHIEYPKQ